MALKLMGKKRGMTQRFDSNGNCIACTVIEIEPNVVTYVRTLEKEGYNALQTGAGLIQAKDDAQMAKKVGKPLFGAFVKRGVAPRRHLIESRMAKVEGYEPGQELTVSLLSEVGYVDVCGASKGKGFQGVMKLHGFSGIGRSHGAGPVHRHAGSTGMRSTPGRCLPNGKRASRMGGRRTTVQNLEIVHIDLNKNLLLVRGAVPGAVGGLLYVSPAKKMAAKAA